MSSNPKKKQHYVIRQLVLTSFFAALIFVATMYLPRIPTLHGYIHLGDGFIFIAAALLPAPYALAAAAIGGSLADLLSGYAIWIPATFIIKALMAACVSSKTRRIVCVRNCIGLIIAALINASGYYLFQALFISSNFIAPLPDIPLNLAQTLFGGVVFVLVSLLLDRSPSLKRIISHSTDGVEHKKSQNDENLS